MALTGVEPATARDQARAVELAQLFGVPVLEPLRRGADGVRLVVGSGGLALAFEDRARGKPFGIDWSAILRRPPLARNHIFRRALGGGVTLVDATAGFGTDAWRALTLGKTVTAIERAPVVTVLLHDALARARTTADLAPLAGRLTVVGGDASDFLAGHKTDVVYLDPMFSKLKSTAKSPKEMQLLQELLGEHDPADERRLFEAAMAAARARVVVKRALKARATAGPAPAHAFAGQSVRYDVYPRG